MGDIALSLRDLREPSFVAGRLSSDEHLARMASRGSTRAFAVLYERHHQSLFRYCRSIVGQPEDARDALQSTMMRAFAALGAGERDLAVRPWLFRIAHNESISILRRRRADESIVPEELAGGCDVEGTVEQRERLALLVADLQVLVERQRAALVMRELSGLSIEEIAAALSCSPGGAKQALFEARTALHEMSEGRAMGCEAIRRAISEQDGRVLRGRKLRAHLRACAGCREFGAAIGARRADMRALVPPLPPAAGIALLRGLLASGGHASKGIGTLVAAGNNVEGATVAGTGGGGVGLTGTGATGAGIAGTSTSGTLLGGHLMGSLAAKALVGAVVVATAATGATRLAFGPSRSGRPATSHRGTDSAGAGRSVTLTQRAPLAVSAPQLSLSPRTKMHATGAAAAAAVLDAGSSRHSPPHGLGGVRSKGARGDLRHASPGGGHTSGKARALERRSGTAGTSSPGHAGRHGSPSAGKAGKGSGDRGGARPGERSSAVGNANGRAHQPKQPPAAPSAPSPSSRPHPSGGAERAGAPVHPQPRGQSSAPAAVTRATAEAAH